MMQILIVKTTSMGDVIHTLPALTDAGRHVPGVRFDWVVEKPFAEIPRLHPLVDTVIPVSIRQWRKNWWQAIKSDDFKQFRKQVKSKRYDFIVDAQGLLKSALLARMAKGKHVGLSWQSAREPLASLFYQQKIVVAKNQHAISRVRQLFANALGYAIEEEKITYGIDRNQIVPDSVAAPYVVFLHGTTWVTKHWPEAYWETLAKQIVALGYHIKLPWGNEIEKARAERIAKVHEHVRVLPKCNLMTLASELAGAQAVVAVDTGLGHLSAALDVPTVSLYGPTDPNKIGTQGASQRHLKEAVCCDKACSAKGCAIAKSISPACFEPLTPQKVMDALCLPSQ